MEWGSSCRRRDQANSTPPPHICRRGTRVLVGPDFSVDQVKSFFPSFRFAAFFAAISFITSGRHDGLVMHRPALRALLAEPAGATPRHKRFNF